MPYDSYDSDPCDCPDCRGVVPQEPEIMPPPFETVAIDGCNCEVCQLIRGPVRLTDRTDRPDNPFLRHRDNTEPPFEQYVTLNPSDLPGWFIPFDPFEAPERSPVSTFNLEGLTEYLTTTVGETPDASLVMGRGWFYALNSESEMPGIRVDIPLDTPIADYIRRYNELRSLACLDHNIPIVTEDGQSVGPWGPVRLAIYVSGRDTFAPQGEDTYIAYRTITLSLAALVDGTAVSRYAALDTCYNNRCSMVTPLTESGCCSECGLECSNCASLYNEDDGENGQCPACNQYVAFCDSCGDGISRDYDVHHDDGDVLCAYCYEGRHEEDEYGDGGYHPGRGRPDSAEEFDAELPPVSFLLDDIPGVRVNRRIGLEIEGGGNSGILAQALRDVEASEHDRPVGYHHQTSRGGSTFTVESDATVDWEMVSPVLDLTQPEDADLTYRAVNTLWNLSQGTDLWHDYRAGLHIHVGAEHIPITAAYRLGHLWNFVENAVFRLSAAKWGHHRIHEQGTTFCQPLPKGFKNRQEFSRTINRAGRYAALSFQNYLSSHISNCGCGAVQFDSWDNCICPNLGKCTFEFRVFNATSNPLKLKAYIGLVQALVNYAINMEPISDEEWDELYPAQGYSDMESTPFHSELYDGLTKALRFIFDELPLSDSERDALAYCVRESDLASLGEEFTTNRSEVLV